MKKSQKVFTLIFVIVLIAACGIFLYRNKNLKNNSEEKNVQASSTNTTITLSAPSNPDMETYMNIKYGFSVGIPNGWDTTDKGNSVIIGINGYYPDIFRITAFTKTEWNNLQKNASQSQVYLGENTGYVFASSQGQDYEKGATDKQKEILSIISSFKVVK